MVGTMGTKTTATSVIPFVMLGLAVPSLVFGRTVMAVLVTVFLLAAAASGPLRSVFLEGLRRPVGTALFYLVLLMFACWVPGLGESRDLMDSAQVLLRTALIFVLFVPFLALLQVDRNLHEVVLKAMIASAVVFAAYALFAILVTPQIYWGLRLHGWDNISPAFKPLKAYSALAVMVVPVSLWCAVRFMGLWRAAALVAAGGFLVLVWLTSNRAAMAGLIGAAIVVAALLSNRMAVRYRFLAALFAAGLVAAVSYWLFHDRAPIEVPEGEWLFPTWLIDFERQAMWRHVWNIAWEFPWFGIGINTINLTPGADVIIPGTNDTHMVSSHPHNWMVEIFAETGLFGLLSLCGVFLFAAIRIVRGYLSGRNPAWLAAIAVLTGYWTSGLFNFSVWAAWWQISLLIMMAVVLTDVIRRPGSAAGP